MPAAWRGKTLEFLPETPGLIEPGAAWTQAWDGDRWTAQVPLSAQRSESPTEVPLVLALFGVGMTLGNLIIPRFAVGKKLMPCIAGLLLWSMVMLALFPLAAHDIRTISLLVVLIGMGGAIGTLLQVRLMDVAPDAQTMAGALNNSAFNAANALGPFLGGLAINAGFGWTSTGIVGSLLALGGLIIWCASYRLEKHTASV